MSSRFPLTACVRWLLENLAYNSMILEYFPMLAFVDLKEVEFAHSLSGYEGIRSLGACKRIDIKWSDDKKVSGRSITEIT